MSIVLDSSSSQYISLDVAKAPTTSVGTIEAWVYFNTGDLPAANNTYVIWSLGDSGVGGKHHWLAVSRISPTWTGYRLRVFLNWGGTVDISRYGTTELSENVHYHVAVTQDGGGTQLYLNGVAEGMNDFGAQADPTAWWDDCSPDTSHMGVRQLPTFSAYFNGEISELRIWDSALSSSQLLCHMNRRVCGDGAVSVWRLDESTGTTAYDYNQTIGNDGTLQNSATWGGSPPIAYG